MRIAWHLDGMSLDAYCAMSVGDRIALQNALTDMIIDTDPDGGAPPRPKKLRKGIM